MSIVLDNCVRQALSHYSLCWVEGNKNAIGLSASLIIFHDILHLQTDADLGPCVKRHAVLSSPVQLEATRSQ